MKKTLYSLHSHIKDHHKKYLFGIFGVFAVVKLVLFILGLSVVQYSYTHTQIFAQLETGCVLTGQYYTGEYETGGYLTWQELTGGYLTWCTMLSGYRTWGDLDVSWNLTWQTRIEEETQTWCELIWQTLTEWYMTWGYLTWGYRTWWTVFCNEELGTGDLVQTWTTQTWTTQQQNSIVTWWNGICESEDIVWNAPVSWSIVREIFPITWAYSGTDCLVSWLSLQLRDHNGQRITIGTFASWTTTTNFDSRRLYSFQNNGLYHIIGNTGAGNFTLYWGIATWAYSRLFTWYKLRLLTPHQLWLYETSTFTIDNQLPTLSWITLTANWSATWYLNISGSVTLTFTASEMLSWIHVTLWSDKVPTTSTFSWLLATYTRTITSLYPEGTLAANISFADAAGNTGAVVYTSSLMFDVTRPVITGFVFNESTSGLLLNFIWSEPVKYSFNYQRTWWTLMTGATQQYLTAQHILFSWIERDQLYIFRAYFFDIAGNSRSITGDFMRTNLWQIRSHISLAPITNEVALSWNLATLAVVLKAEVEKFNACKNALSYTPIELEVRRKNFVIQMPSFKKSQMKTLVNAFTLFVLDEIKKDYTISKDDIDDITKKFDDFLVILKLIRDDDNVCKQNLSNYHIGHFQKALEEYKISLN